ACYRAKIYDGAKLRTPQIACERIALPNIDARNKTELSTKTWREIVVFAEKIKFASGVGNICVQTVALLGGRGRLRQRILCRHIKLLAQLRKICILPRPAVRALKIGHAVGREFQTRV